MPKRATSQKTYNRRLLKLADFLEALPRRRFDFGAWVGRDWTGDPTLQCGTTACALGWATTMPEFRRLGLRMSERRKPVLIGRGGRPRTAAVEIFGLTSAPLFLPSAYDSVQNKISPVQLRRAEVVGVDLLLSDAEGLFFGLKVSLESPSHSETSSALT